MSDMSEDQKALKGAIEHIMAAAELLSAAGYFNRARDLCETVLDLNAISTANLVESLEEPVPVHLEWADDGKAVHSQEP